MTRIRCKILSSICIAILSAAVVTHSVYAAEGVSVAVILKIEGPASREHQPYSTVQAGSKIRLSENSILTFRLLGQCRTVVIRGGLIVFSNYSFNLSGGRIVGSTQNACLRRVALERTQGVGGIKLRGKGSNVFDIGVRPVFIYSGAKPPKDLEIRILKNKKVIMQGRLRGKVLVYPKENADLKVGKFYDIELRSDRGAKFRRLQARVKNKSASQSIFLIDQR